MGPPVDRIVTDPELPPRTGIVVIGGGIIGVSAALSLAQAGVAVTLCEKGEIGGEQSSRNWGWVRKTNRDEREIPLILEALRRWGGMNRTVEAETGFRECGVLYVAESDADQARYEAWVERARAYQIGTRMIAGTALAEQLPGAAKAYRSAMYTPSDGRAEPQQAAPAIAAAARRLGATILTNCAVRGLDMAAGKVAAVVTEHGRIACDGVILAGGAWSRLFCGHAGIRLPQLKVRASVLRTEPLEGGPETSAWLGGFAYRKRMDGGYTIANGRGNLVSITPDTFRLFREFLPAARTTRRGLRLRLDRSFLDEARTPKHWALDAPSPFETIRTLDPDPAPRLNSEALQAASLAFPVFKRARIAQQWAGMIDVTPDAIPVISPVAQVPGLVVATGFSGHGFGIGPAAGQLAADLAIGAPPIVDPTPFRYSRFSDGSKIVIDAGI